ncbi:MAG: DUF3619 family protein [Casimicrobiaceae bacterium]
MTNDHEEFAKKITTYLDAGTAEIKSGTAYRLQLARAAALARLAPGAPRHAPQAALARAFAGGNGSGDSGNFWKSGRLWFGILLIAAGGFAFQQWQLVQHTRELEELDAQILTSDLPIDAYLDRGFQTWLTRREP